MNSQHLYTNLPHLYSMVYIYADKNMAHLRILAAAIDGSAAWN